MHEQISLIPSNRKGWKCLHNKQTWRKKTTDISVLLIKSPVSVFPVNIKSASPEHEKSEEKATFLSFLFSQSRP